MKTNPRGASAPAPLPSLPVKRFALTGPSVRLDPTVHAFREDVADVALAGQVIAPHYAMAVIKKARLSTKLRFEPMIGAEVSTLLAGSEFAVLDCGRDHAWGYAVVDHRVGYVELAALD